MRTGLLTLLVNERTAAAAIAAVVEGPTYTSGGSIYRNNVDDWFEPVGILKFAGTSPAEPSPPVEKESQEMNVKTLARAAVKKVASVISGPPEFSDLQVEQFRAAQKHAADLEPARLAVRELQAERVRIGQAIDAGAAEVDGKLPTAARNAIDDQLRGASARLSKASEAYDQLPGLCPDSGLQKARRQWGERNRQLGTAAANGASRLTEARRELRRCSANIETPSPNRPASEADYIARQLAASQRTVDELVEQGDEIAAQQSEHAADREALFATMRAFQA